MKCWCEHLAAKSFINTYETFHSFKRKRNQITCFIRTYCGGVRWYAFSCNSLISHVIPSISNLTGTICIYISLVRHLANTNELYKTLSAALHSCAEFRFVFNFPFVKKPFLKFHTLSIICIRYFCLLPEFHQLERLIKSSLSQAIDSLWIWYETMRNDST